jgi:hypothetical protein
MRASFTGQAARLAVILALVDFLAVATWAQSPAAESGPTGLVKKALKAAPANGPRAAAKPQSGQQEGIKVHGQWTIVIRNEDGTVAARHEFKNKLTDFRVLPQLLAHGGPVGEWNVLVVGNGSHPCLGPSPTTTAPCILVETSGAPTFGSLKVTASPTNLMIHGSVQAAFQALLGTVSTSFALCAPSEPPSITCPFTRGVGFTSADISSLNIQVAAGQTIDVTVVISFS